MSGVRDYDFEGLIGEGASGAVWKARRRGPVTQVVAVKRLHGTTATPADLDAFRWEASVLTDLDHPHIVRVLEVFEDGKGIAVAMQLAPGGSLEQLLQRQGRLAPGEVVAVTAPIASALASAHRRQIIHADVKPANVLFTRDGEPLLGDFGVSRRYDFTAGQIAGTPAYIAPELLVGGMPEPRVDVYSLGVVCYEALAGRVPHGGQTTMDVITAADQGNHQSLASFPDVPPALAEVVERAMARDPNQRYATADEFAQALRSAVPQEEIRVPASYMPPDDPAGGTQFFGPRPPAPEETTRSSGGSKLPIIIVLGVLALAAAGGLAFVLLSGDDEDEPQANGGGTPTEESECTSPDDASGDTQVVEGDPEGDGSEVEGVYEDVTNSETGETGMRLCIEVEGEPREFVELGAPGDQLFLGDWDCDGVDTIGLYQRESGEVTQFTSWETDDAEPDTSSRTPGQTAELRTVPDDHEGRAQLECPAEIELDAIFVPEAEQSS